MQYDAIEQPDPEIWLELDEAERVDLVIDYHRRIGVQLENPELHAVAHVVVENQVALGEATPAPETLERLMDEGLDRHEAVHAIGSILMEIVFDAAHKPDDGGDINANYYRELALLTAADWRMKAAAANDASTHPLNEAEAIRLNRKLWGNPAAASVLEAEFNGVESKKKKSPKKRSATEVADRCIETVRATIENAITGLLRAHAPRAKFELLFEALGEILVDVQRQILEADDEARRRVCRRDQDSGSRSWRDRVPLIGRHVHAIDRINDALIAFRNWIIQIRPADRESVLLNRPLPSSSTPAVAEEGQRNKDRGTSKREPAALHGQGLGSQLVLARLGVLPWCTQ